MSLGLLFLKRTDRQGWFRNAVIVFAITMATAVLMSSMALGNAIYRQSERGFWRFNLIYNNVNRLSDKPLEELGDRTVIKVSNDLYKKEMINEIGIYQLTEKSPLPLDLKSQPQEDEILVSKALMELYEKEEEIQERFKGYRVKQTAPESILSSPHEKLAIYQIPKNLLTNPELTPEMRTVDQAQVSRADEEMKSAMQMMINIFMAVCGVGVCFPLLVLVISATRVGMMQREQRYAALSLIGTSKQQINRIMMAETLAGTGIGIVLGLAVFQLTRYLILANLKLGQDVFFFEDLTISLPVLSGVILLILAVAGMVNWWALRKVKASPLGVVKHQKKLKRPMIFGLLPLIVSAGALWKLNQLGPDWFYENMGANGQLQLMFMAIFLAVMIGLLTSGAYLTYLVAKILEKTSRRANMLMATKRLQLFAKPIFSSVSGMVLALFVSSFFMTMIASATASFEKYYKQYDTHVELSKQENTENQLRFTDYNRNLGYFEKKFEQDEQLKKLVIKQQVTKRFIPLNAQKDQSDNLNSGRVYSCKELKEMTKLSCQEGMAEDKLIVVSQDFKENKNQITELTPEMIKQGRIYDDSLTMSFRNIPEREQARVRIQNIVAISERKDGMRGFLETVDDNFNPTESIEGFIQAVLAGTAVTIAMAGFSVAVSMIGSFFERKKSFGNLRLIGLDIESLYKVVLVESLLPMALASVVAVSAGILMAKYSASAMTKQFVFRAPGLDYFLMIGGAMVVTILIIMATLPILKKITGMESNRTE